MEKREILETIRRLAEANGGQAPGRSEFIAESGYGEGAWSKYWARWGDAVREAGYQPKTLQVPHDETLLIRKLIDLSRELGHFPTGREIALKRRVDPTLPSRTAFELRGSKAHRASAVLEYCKANSGLDDVATLCEDVLANKAESSSSAEAQNGSLGYVYLVRHGNRHEYKIGRTNNVMRREGEIGIELPERGEPVHTIKTDDPAGVERYWHDRFKEKRKNGEWFALSSHDVQAFKKWKRIC